MPGSTSSKSNRFLDALDARWAQGLSISIGLDGELSRLPTTLQSMEPQRAIVEFNRRIIESTADLAAAYKPNAAFYESMGTPGWNALHATVEAVRELAPGVPVILDAKRADIGNTNEHYAVAAFDVLGVDALTVNPYLGPEAAKPFLDRGDRGIIVLCRTSNPGAGRYQDLTVNGRPLYQHIAEDIAATWNYNGNCGLVVGATYPEEIGVVRSIVGDMPVLVPGIGAQGGDIEATITNGADSRRQGLILHAGRSIIYAFEKHSGLSIGEASRRETESLQAQIVEVQNRSALN